MRLFTYILIIVAGNAVLSLNLLSQQDEDQSQFRISQGNGTISGSVIDKDNHSPLEGVVITVTKIKDSSKVGGAETDKKGVFSVEVPYGMYKLEVNYVGYSVSFVNKVAVSPKEPYVTLDTIRLKQGTATTEEIEVTSERSVIEFTPEKKIFNVEQSPIGNTGTATDVLKNVPSVTVDNDGNVSLRGSQNVRILIDGKPVTQNVSDLLESIPSSSVQSVELITNPSARYEAEGETGFINIVLKKSSMMGYNGNISLSGATRDKYNASLNLNLKNKKVNIFFNYSFQTANLYMTETNKRYDTGSSTIAFLDQPDYGARRMLSNLGKIGLDYSFNDFQTVGISTTLGIRKRNNNENQLNSGYDINGALFSQTNTNQIEDSKGLNFNIDLTYNAKWKKNPKHTLTMEASFSRSNNDNNQNLIIGNYISNYVPANMPSTLQLAVEKDRQNLGFFQSDYSHPFGKDSKFDAGMKFTFRENNNDYTFQNYDYATGQWIINNAVSNQFDYKEYISAAYLIFASKIKDFSYQLGLRSEYTNTKGDLITTGQLISKKYVNFFPSASLSQTIGSNELQLSYSRRLNRPDNRELNPFLSYEDPLNLRIGNPDLNPEYIDSYEFSYLKFIKSTIVTGSVFLRETHGLITRFRTLLDSLRTLTTLENISSARSYGTELILNTQFTKWWSFSGNFSYFKTDINGSNVQADLTNSGYSWNTKFITNARLPFGFSVSVSYFYVSKRPTALGSIQPLQSMDISIKKEFMQGNASFSVRGSDVFNAQKFNITGGNVGFTQNLTRKRDTQNLYFTFTYKFGNIKENMRNNAKKRKEDDNNKVPDEDL